MLDIS